MLISQLLLQNTNRGSDLVNTGNKQIQKLPLYPGVKVGMLIDFFYTWQTVLLYCISILRQSGWSPMSGHADEPAPIDVILFGFNPDSISTSRTASARCWDSGVLIASLPVLSVFPITLMQ